MSNVRVESRNLHYNASKEQQERAFRTMLAIFKKRVNDCGILTEYNQRQEFESKGQKRRRKKKEAEAQRYKEVNFKNTKDNLGQVNYDR